MRRVITYIDGFNLYFGLRSKNWRRLYWLNVQELARRLMQPNHQLVYTKYFTARISGPADKLKRQETYLEALATLKRQDFDMYFGRYQSSLARCRFCLRTYTVEQEKMTDVNIAVEMMKDAFQDGFDTALLISGDADLVAPIMSVRSLFPDKRVVVAFPPDRSSKALIAAAHGYFTIGRAHLRQSQFPLEVVKPDGFVLRCPSTWT